MPNVSASLWIVLQQSLWVSHQNFSTNSVALLVRGRPEHLSSSTDTLSGLKNVP
jgi:hypothetical protein